MLLPLLPFGTPPPLGIEFAPPKMRDLLFHKGANRAFMKTPLEKSLSLALTYSSSEQYSLNIARGERKATRRARRPCLLNYPSSLRGRISRRGVPARTSVSEHVSVVVKYTLNKCTSERLHFERDNVMSSDVTLKRRVIPSSKEKHRARGCALSSVLWTDALIWMQNKEKAPAQGASVLMRTCSAERVLLTQLCAK